MPCAIVLGDIDYIADATLIRRHYDAPWSQWQTMVREQLARAQTGPNRCISLYARGRSLSEKELLLRLVQQANDFQQARILLHHFDSAAAVPALDAYNGRALLSYVSGENWMQPALRAMLALHQPQLVVQPVNDGGIPATAEERLAVVEQVWRLVEPFGLLRSDLFVDAMSPALGTVPFAPIVSVQTVALAQQHGFSSIAWPCNVGLGHKDRHTLTSAFTAQLVHAGLDLAVVASHDTAVLTAVAAANALRHAGSRMVVGVPVTTPEPALA